MVEPPHQGLTPQGKRSEDAPPDEVERAIKRYLDSKSKGDGSGYYRNTAKTVLGQWLRWLRQRNRDSFVDLGDDEVGPKLMRRYAQRLTQRVSAGGITPSSARTYYNIISAFLTYCVRDGELDTNPALKDRAREELPEDVGERKQQFWDITARQKILKFVNDRAYRAIEARGLDAEEEARDRALVYVLAYSGVRGAEILRTSSDDREGRQGITWKHVDLERGVMRVLGKAQEWEDAPLPRQARAPLARWKKIQNPPVDEWPVFPTSHTPSHYAAARTGMTELGYTEDEIEEVLNVNEDVTDVLRRYEVAPPALTTDGARKLMQRLCEEAGVAIDGEYLKLHGARRGIGDTIYRVDRGDAQDLLRHKSLETTREAYSHIDAEEQSERVSRHLDELDE